MPLVLSFSRRIFCPGLDTHEKREIYYAGANTFIRLVGGKYLPINFEWFSTKVGGESILGARTLR